MLHGDTVAALGAIERRYDVADWTVGGLHVWPILRTQLAARMMARGRVAPSVGPSRRIPAIRDVVRSSKGALGKREAPPTADVVFLSRPTNRQHLDGAWVDRFFDPIADILGQRGLRTLHLEYRAGSTQYRLPRHRPSWPIRGDVIRQLGTAALRVPRSRRLDGHRQLSRHVASEYGIRVPGTTWLTLRAQAVLGVARHFERLLAGVQPKAVMGTCYYSLVGMAMSLAASRAGVPSIDVQHGVTQRNPAYDGWTRFPTGGYAILPDRFWCWTDHDAAPIERWPAEARSHHSAFVGGHPWVALWETEQSRTSEYVEQIDRMRGGALNVLVTLTWSSGWSDALKAIVRGAPASWRWWIRLHPTMEGARPQIARWCADNVAERAFVAQPTDLPLPLLLRRADVHLTHNSSVVQEATAVGTPSVMIDRRGLDVYTDDLASGWAQFAEAPEAVYAALGDQCLRKDTLTRRRPYPSWRDVSAAVGAMLEPNSHA